MTGVMRMPKRSASADCRATRSEQAVVSLSVKNPPSLFAGFSPYRRNTRRAPYLQSPNREWRGRNGQKRHRQTGIRILLNVFHYIAAVDALVINKHQQLVLFSGSLKRDGLEVSQRVGNIVYAFGVLSVAAKVLKLVAHSMANIVFIMPFIIHPFIFLILA
jgi:hypothetical protein